MVTTTNSGLLAQVDGDRCEQREPGGQEDGPELLRISPMRLGHHLLHDHGHQRTTGHGEHGQSDELRGVTKGEVAE